MSNGKRNREEGSPEIPGRGETQGETGAPGASPEAAPRVPGAAQEVALYRLAVVVMCAHCGKTNALGTRGGIQAAFMGASIAPTCGQCGEKFFARPSPDTVTFDPRNRKQRRTEGRIVLPGLPR